LNRVLVVAKRSARGTRIKALTQMRQLTFSDPDHLQGRLKGLPIAQFVATAQGLRPTRSSVVVTRAQILGPWTWLAKRLSSK
jgi:hypothetical protein